MSAAPELALADPRLTLGALRWSTGRQLVRERWRLLLLARCGGAWPLGGLLVGGCLSVAMSTLTAYAVGWLVTRTLQAHEVSAVVEPVLLVAVLVVLGQSATLASEVAGTLVARRVDGAIRRRVRRIALSPGGIGHLDDPGFRDDIERACDLGLGWRNRSPGNAVIGQVSLVFRVVSGLAAAVVLGLVFPALAAGVLVASLFVRTMVRRQWIWLAEMDVVRMGDSRQAQYLAGLASDSGAAKDVRLFGLSRWLTGRMHAAEIRARTPGWQARTRLLQHRQGLSSVLILAMAAATLWAVGISQEPVGVAARCLTAAFLVMQLSALGPEIFDIDYGVITIRALDRVVARYVPPPSARPALPVTGRPPLVQFDDVSFTYPGTGLCVLSGLTFEVRPDEVLAIVGINGAGKTTLVKLMAGLYVPTSGRILVNGVPLTDVDLESWRRQMTVLFQDFVHYGTTVHDNIALSAPEYLDDAAGVESAIHAAGAEDLVAGLPDGAATVLWKGGTASRDLSGGQWQKIAISRALFAVSHGRRLLVLDEPTAHLDVEAEHQFNERITARTEDASVVIISHRLSNVRGADRIAVLEGGRVTESGSHDALIQADGSYARLFRLQASRFTDVVA